MEEKMKSNLKIGFTLSRWGIDSFWGALIFAILWIVMIIINPKVEADYFKIIAIILIFAGMILFFIGRIFVGLQSRKLNFLTGRTRNDEEEWFLQEMLWTEKTAVRLNLANNLAKILPGKADNILIASNSTGVIKHFFNVGKIYMSNNFLINRLVLIASLFVSIILLMVKLI